VSERLRPLLDRDQETRLLEAAWQRAVAGASELAVVWGRRRVGKTFLLSHFAAGRRAVHFGATQQSQGVELRRFAETVRSQLGDRALDLAGGGFRDWEGALRFATALAADEPLLLILDEVPYLAQSTPGFASIVQTVWDHLPTGTHLMLALTGSAISTVEAMLGPSGPLRGRPTLRLRLEPVDPLGGRLFLPKLDPTSYLEAYAACGGYPLHLLAWDEQASTTKNLRRLAVTPGGILLDDATGILREELPDTGGYPRILAAIGRGATRFSEIASEADQRIDHALDVLIEAGFVRKALPIGSPRGARPGYEIADPYLAFWFSLLYQNVQLIDSGQGGAVLQRTEPLWQRHLGWVFEELARSHARRLVVRGELPGDLVVGRWWATRGPQCELDVLGLRGSRTALLGEARWQARPLSVSVLNELRQKLAYVPSPLDDPTYVLWGRHGVEGRVAASGGLGFGLEHMLT
jgi:uncharacterized protein